MRRQKIVHKKVIEVINIGKHILYAQQNKEGIIQFE